MAPIREIRADFDARGIVVYQAYSPAIADAAVRAGRFVSPFSFQRMTWIKPSFAWLMHRSQWARKAGQERILAVRMDRGHWEDALSRAALTTGDPDRLADAEVHVQWDPERTLRGAALNHYSVQVGIGRTLVRDYAERWATAITDITPLVRRIDELMRSGRHAQAKRLVPTERAYPLPRGLAERLGAD